MRRLLIALAALLLILAATPVAANDRDESATGSSQDDDAQDEAEDAEDEAEDRAEDAEDLAEDRRDDGADGADDDDRHADDGDRDDDSDGRGRHRNRNRGRGATDRGGAGGGGGTAPPSGPPATTATVTVQDDAFAPATISVATGGTVTWRNVSREHTVTADDNSFDSGVFDAGQRYQRRFDQAGAFAYRCLIHPDMTGQVIVGGSAAKAATSRAPGAEGAGPAPPRRTAPQSASGGSASSGLPNVGQAAIPAPVAAATGPVSVDVLEFEFAPEHVEVAPGTTVQWTLSGSAPHTVTSEAFDSGMLKPGESFEQTFDDVGTFDYRCDFHPEMTGTVAVVEGAEAGSIDPGGGDAAPTGDEESSGGTASARDSGSDDAPPATASGVLAETGLRGWPALLAALAVILVGWAALVTGRRRIPRRRTAA